MYVTVNTGDYVGDLGKHQVERGTASPDVTPGPRGCVPVCTHTIVKTRAPHTCDSQTCDSQTDRENPVSATIPYSTSVGAKS